MTLARFARHERVTLLGPVADTRPVYESHRVFVAPARFAAGLPYKVHEAASFGVPVVATELLSDQLGWAAGRELLAAPASDPASFAEAVLTLYREEAAWNRVREAALARIAREHGARAYADALAAILS